MPSQPLQPNALQPCPCGSGHPYANCCSPYLSGESWAPTAEALMRSRYTAFCTGDIDYLLATHASKRHTARDRLVLTQTIRNTRWVGLKILKTQQGRAQDQRGVVEFVALFQSPQAPGPMLGEMNQLHERSRFVKRKGQWFYVDGDLLPALP